jgi:hypothetical protein
MWFYVSSHTSVQNIKILSNENSQASQQVPLHAEEIGVLCAVIVEQIIKLIFFTRLKPALQHDQCLVSFVASTDS